MKHTHPNDLSHPVVTAGTRGRRLLRHSLVLSMLLVPLASAQAQISLGISFPGVDIGINMPVYPAMVRVPGYPVYYASSAQSNYFFYDGLYWVYQDDSWYESNWYNGPWSRVMPEDVPLFVLRVPVRYYRRPPPYFGGWRADAAPQWGTHWGRDWEQRRPGWNQWDHRSAPAAAPLPKYQRRYSGDRYPDDRSRQESIRSEHYRYAPKEAATRQHWQQGGRTTADALDERQSTRSEPQHGFRKEAGERQHAQDQQRIQDQQRAREQQGTQEQRQRVRPPEAQHPDSAPQGRGREPEGDSRGQGKGNRKDGQDRDRN